MNGYKSLFVCLLLLVVGVGLPSACGQSAPVITSHQDGDTVYYGAQVTLQCSGGTAPLTWSGDGAFSPSTGSQVTWTAPASGATATVTVTDGCNLSDSVTFNLTNIIFVDKERPGNDGTTWPKAFKHLQDALAVAGSGSEIWVADATYKPDEDKDNPTGTGSQSSTFTLVAGAAVYGGFEGNETSRGQRDWVAHETILSGDINGGGLDAGNSRHVVRCTSGTSTTVLDGFTVTMGFSDAGLADGGGIDLVNCSPTIANCLIKDNKADSDDGDGGGMHCLNASPTVTNCIFIDNIAGDDGGALCNKNGSNGTFTNCVFYSNETESDELDNGGSHGGAIFNTRGEGDGYVGSDPTFVNCIIAGNLCRKRAGVGGGDGGGAADNDTGTDVTWINCTFYANTAQDDGGGLASRDGGASTVKNCIFWDDTAGGNGPELWQGGTPDGTATVTYSDVEGGWSGNINSDPKFFSVSDLDGPDDRFLTIDDGLEIDVGSPCIDTGTSTGAPSQDATGRIRPLDGDENGSALYDMGAYEFQSIIEKEPYLIYPGETATPGSTAQMTVLWQLTQTRTCTLEWGTTTSYGNSVQTTEINTGTYGHQHRHILTGLAPATEYYYHIAGVGAGNFHTAPTPSATSTGFLVYSDTQGSNGSPATYYDAVCSKMVAAYAADPNVQTFALHCGDHVDRGGSETAWKNEYFARSKQGAMDLLANVPVLGCVGNHEIRDSGGTYRAESYYDTLLFNKYYPYPFAGPADTSYWSFDYGPAHVVVLDQYATGTFDGNNGNNRIGSPQLDWLKNDLKNTDRSWKFVIFHETGYAGTGTYGTAYQEVRNTLQPVFDANDVDIVFAGHEHYYCHGAVGDVNHVTTGGGGGGLASYSAAAWHVAPNPTSQGVKHHFCKVTINGDTLTLQAIDKDGNPIESFTIQH